MTIRLGINGFGRIGRCVLRALYEEKLWDDVKVVAINSIGDLATNAHLLRYDTTHGRFGSKVEIIDGQDFEIDGDPIKMYSTRDPHEIDWAASDVDVVLECTGAFRSREKAGYHLQSGAKKVLISAPGVDCDATVVYGVNDEVLTPDMKIVSNGSCTTNCLAPIAKALDKGLGIERGLMTTIHSFTNDQVLVDVYHKDLRRARSALSSMIPTKTGAAAAIGLVLPHLAGRLDGVSIRVPTQNVSFVDLTFMAGRETTVEEVNEIMKLAAKDPGFHNVLDYTEEKLVSHDYNHTHVSSTFDGTFTKVNEGKSNFVKVGAWYDNEWGFSCRMLDTACAMARCK